MAYGNSSGKQENVIFRALTSSDSFVYGFMVFASLRPRLLHLRPDGSLFGIAAEIDGKPVGALIAEATDNSTRILSIYVKQANRGQGIGETMMCEAEKIAQDRFGAMSMVIGYLAGRTSTKPLEAIFERLGWAKPEGDTLICKSRIGFEGWSLFDGSQGCSEDFHLFPWAQLTDEDRRWIETTQKSSPWIPPDLYPLQFPTEGLEHINSLGIRHEGRPVGWVLTHRVAADTIRYTCSFMHPEHQRGLHIFPAYREAARLQKLAGIPNLIWLVPFQHRGMARWVLRRWPKDLVTYDESRRCTKRMQQDTLLHEERSLATKN